jgi:hypothetical protein
MVFTYPLIEARGWVGCGVSHFSRLMLLDAYHLHTLIVQLSYDEAFELWDRAGAIARGLTELWPGVELDTATPGEQTFRSSSVVLQTSLKTSTITLWRPKLDPTTIARVTQSFEVLRSQLELQTLSRVSCRSKYVKDFTTQEGANSHVLRMGLTPWPDTRVFDQPTGGNGNAVEVVYRFEDEASFAVLRVGSEHLNVNIRTHPEVENEVVERKKHRAYIDFDRGMVAAMDARILRLDEWLKGYQHLLRRDIEKVIRVSSAA